MDGLDELWQIHTMKHFYYDSIEMVIYIHTHICPSLPGTVPVLLPKVPCPGKPLSPRGIDGWLSTNL